MGGDEVRWTHRPQGASMKIGMIISNGEPPGDGRIPRFSDIQSMAQRAEAVGFDSVWQADHFLTLVSGVEF